MRPTVIVESSESESLWLVSQVRDCPAGHAGESLTSPPGAGFAFESRSLGRPVLRSSSH